MGRRRPRYGPALLALLLLLQPMLGSSQMRSSHPARGLIDAAGSPEGVGRRRRRLVGSRESVADSVRDELAGGGSAGRGGLAVFTLTAELRPGSAAGGGEEAGGGEAYAYGTVEVEVELAPAPVTAATTFSVHGVMRGSVDASALASRTLVGGLRRGDDEGGRAAAGGDGGDSGGSPTFALLVLGPSGSVTGLVATADGRLLRLRQVGAGSDLVELLAGQFANFRTSKPAN